MVSIVKTHKNVSDKVQKKELKKCKPILRSKPSLSWHSLWQNLPDLIFSDIMLMVGREGLLHIQKYRQVCQNLSVKITQMTDDQAQERHRQGSEEEGGVERHEI